MSSSGNNELDDDKIVFDELVNFEDVVRGQIKTPLRQFAGANWTVLVRNNPGNNVKPLGVWVGVDTPQKLPVGWCRSIFFYFELVNADETKNVESVSRITFRFDRAYAEPGNTFLDQGFAFCFGVDRAVLNDPAEGYLNANGQIRLRIHLQNQFERTRAPLNHNPKAVTGMVGLENQGATCYLNALLQMLYHITEFRKAVYLLPVPDQTVTVDSSTTLALQSVFHNLQVKDSEVNTRDLTSAFGWTSADAFMQQDVQEMLRVLMDKLEEKMDKTVVDGTIKRLFAGKVRSFIRCVNVAYESARDEDFYDIQLDVKGCSNVNESFRRYVEKEMLDGDNRYDAGSEYGKQDAEKGVTFMRFPPVLTMHLKRFAFDFERMGFTKIHDRYEFPVLLNLNEYVSPDAEDDVKAIDHTYELQSVLVHAGDVHGGHYYAYIRPANKHAYGKDTTPGAGKWYMFNDENVYEVHKKDAVDLCFGGGRGVSYDSMSSAYMLVYVRVDSGAEIMAPTISDAESIPRELSDRLVGQQQKELLDRYNSTLNEQYTEVYYWLESDVALFSNYFDTAHTGEFLDPSVRRRLIVPANGTYLSVYMKLLEELKLKPWQLWIFPFHFNGDNSSHSVLSMTSRRVPFPFRSLEPVEWFFNCSKGCRMLNNLPGSSFMYVHITHDFDPGMPLAGKLDHDAIMASYARCRELERELAAEVRAACTADKRPFSDEALNVKPFNYTFGCSIGCTPWPLRHLKSDNKALEDKFRQLMRKFVFEDVLVHVLPLIAERRLIFVKAYDPSGYLSFPWRPSELLTESTMVYQGRVMADVHGACVGDIPLSETDAALDFGARKALFSKRAQEKFDAQVSGCRSKACHVRYVAASFIPGDVKVGMLPLYGSRIIKRAYEQYLNATPVPGGDARLSLENITQLMEKYWCEKSLVVHQFPLPNYNTVASPNMKEVDIYTRTGGAVVKMVEITIEELLTAYSGRAWSSTFYVAHYSNELARNSDTPIFNLSLCDPAQITAAKYMSCLFHQRKLFVCADGAINARETFSKLAREAAVASKKKRPRATLGAGVRGAGVDEEDSGSPAALSPVKEGEEETETETEAKARKDPLLEQFRLSEFECNTSIPLTDLFTAVADMYRPTMAIEASRLMLVPQHTQGVAQRWHAQAEPDVFVSPHPTMALPPLLPLCSSTLSHEMVERKFRKLDSLLLRVTPFPTTVLVDDTSAEGEPGAKVRASLLDVQRRQFEVSISDHRLLSLRRHFLALFRAFSGVAPEDGSPLSPDDDDDGDSDADAVSSLMQSSLSTTASAGKRLKGEGDRVSPMLSDSQRTGAAPSAPSSLEITSSSSYTTFGADNEKQILCPAVAGVEIKLDSSYMEDLYGLLWPLTCTSALPHEFLILKKVYVQADARVDNSVLGLLKTIRNAIGVPVHASNDPNVSNIRRVAQAQTCVSQTESLKSDDNSTTITTTTIETQPVSTPYVSDSTGTTNYSDHRWLNQILSQWLDQASSDPANISGVAATASAGVSTGTAEEADSLSLIASAVGKLSQYLKGSSLLIYRYDPAGYIVNVYHQGASMDLLPRCWLDVQTDQAQPMPLPSVHPSVSTGAGHPLPRANSVRQLEYVPHSSNLAVQFLGANEAKLWEGSVPGLRSFGVFVYNIQCVTPRANLPNRWVTLDTELYGEPLVSFVCETDTIESLTRRVCALSPALQQSTGGSRAEPNIGFMKQVDVAPLWFSDAVELMRSGEGMDSSDNGGGSLWDLLVRLHPDAACPFAERRECILRAQQGVRADRISTLSAYFPLFIGIERATLAAPTAAKSATTRLRKVTSSIKIN